MKNKMARWYKLHPKLTKCMMSLVILLLIGMVIWQVTKEKPKMREYKGNGKATMIDK